MQAALFFASVGLIAFAYFGYPLLLAVVAWVAPKPVRRAPFAPRVTIVVVGYNEEAAIAAKIESCLGQRYPRDSLRLLIVSDGSTDGMPRVVRDYGDARVQLLAFEQRRGKAACLNDALAACQDEFVVLSDARQPLDPDAVAFLMENFADDTVGAVSGELRFRTDGASGFAEGIDAYWRYEKFIRQKESEIGSAVGVSGALYALRRVLWQPIPAQTILDDVLIPMNVAMQDRRVVFDARAVAWDRPSHSPARERVRKVRTLAGNFQLIALRPDFLVPGRNPMFVGLVCHKLLRLVVPLAMALALAANAMLATQGAFWAFALALQLGCYGIAIAGLVVP
ncbi:MAG TPA: glycosyltransferase family 2 protein, partial [Rhodanobacteraceae bacterium]